MQTAATWVRVTGTDQCEPDVAPWRRHGYRPPASSAFLADPSLGELEDPDSLARELIFQDMLETWTQSLVEEIEDQQRAGELPGDLVQGGLERARAGMQRARDGLVDSPRLASETLGEGLASVGALAEHAEAAMFTIAREACERGLQRESGFSLKDWLARRMPWADRSLLAKVQTVATSCTKHLQDRPIGEAVSAGRFPVRRAEIIVVALAKVRQVIDADQYESYVQILIDAAANQKLSDKELRRVTGHLLELVLDQEEADKRERAAHEQRSVHFYQKGEGITRFVIDAPARQAAVLKGVLTSKLAAPQKGPEGELDPRTGRQRGFDALETVVGRGLSCPEGTPQMVRATLFVTMKLDDLRRDTPGHGVTLGGDMLSARQVRQAACEAEIIPVVLGGQSQILDYGTARRLATKEQVKALYLRDGGCTFPGCTVPAQWTIAHHDPWWSRGGATDLNKLALLCEAHHAHVHQHDLECTIDDSGVTWHLR